MCLQRGRGWHVVASPPDAQSMRGQRLALSCLRDPRRTSAEPGSLGAGGRTGLAGGSGVGPAGARLAQSYLRPPAHSVCSHRSMRSPV